MLALLKDKSGKEKAVVIGKTGWVASPVPSNEVLVEISFDDGFSSVISLSQYDVIKKNLVSDGEMIDLTTPERILNTRGA